MRTAELPTRRFALMLALTPGIGPRSLARILVRTRMNGLSPSEFFRLSPEALREEFGLLPEAAARVSGNQAALSERASPIEARLDNLNVDLMTLADASFPALLEQFGQSAPAALFAYGNSRLLTSPTFCVLSSRKSSPSALDRIERLAEEGVLASEVLVTGHNTHEYQRSAIVPLRWGAPRILCLDRGLFAGLGEELTDEPFAAARLWRYRFDPQTDLALSPFRPEMGFGKVTNQLRDRLVVGLSARVDVVEARRGGNMERLARAALRVGRKVRVSKMSDCWDELARLGAEPMD